MIIDIASPFRGDAGVSGLALALAAAFLLKKKPWFLTTAASPLYACKNKEDEVSLPDYEDTIKLSTYLISVDNGGGEAYVTAEYDRWVVDEKE